MGLDTHFDESTIRQRIPNGSHSEIKITYKSSSDTNNNDNDSINEEDKFDAEITTLNNISAKEAIANAEQLPHDLAIQKLKEIGAKTPILPSEIGTDFSFKRKIVWSNALGFLFLHILALIGVGLGLFGFADPRTNIYCKWIHIHSWNDPIE